MPLPSLSMPWTSNMNSLILYKHEVSSKSMKPVALDYGKWSELKIQEWILHIALCLTYAFEGNTESANNIYKYFEKITVAYMSI